MDLSDYETRRKRILLAVIESFIENALPVSSKYVSQISRLNLSAATIRNVMAELEQDGYLTHPHTSAGRVPTAKGYRFYVDHLMTSERLNEEDQRNIEEAFRHSEMMEQVMSKVVRLLCDITDQVAMILCPETASSILKRIELIPLKENHVLAVFITKNGEVKNAIVPLGERAEKEELLRIAHFLNTELVGLSLSEVHENLYRRLLDERSSFFYICKRAKEIIENSGFLSPTGELYLEGARTIFDKPEFRNSETMQAVLSLLEEKKELLNLLRRDAASEGIHVYIDEEVGRDAIRGCTLITSGFRVDQSYGTVGVIGPTRLNYGRLISIVNYVASKMTEWTKAL